jgi:potassium large conductance calcium-activated channel subfamily M alpha protein 1
MGDAKVMDADAIFMYKTIEKNFRNVSIVTELASMNTMSFLVSEQDQSGIKNAGYFASKPFAAGEIFVGSLLNSLMC